MDINPDNFEAPWEAFEFARFHASQRSDIIAFSSAWCNRHPDDKDAGPVDGPETINYWANRLSPLIKLDRDVFFACADRVGQEPVDLFRAGAQGVTTFVGSSCVISLKGPELLCALGTADEGLLLQDVPFEKAEIDSESEHVTVAPSAPTPASVAGPTSQSSATPIAPAQ